jgi:hypothetical protein
MKPKEADIILLEALLQTPNSRADYFRIKAKEGNHDPITFYKDLSEAYQRIEEYVNTDDMRRWGRDEAGNPVFDKQYLFLNEYTGGRVNGSFGRENLLEILEPLHEFGLSIKAAIESKAKTGDEPFRNSVMNDRTEINKYSVWVQEIDRYPEYLDSINPSAYELKKCLDYIQQWKSREFVEINNLLLLNPTMTLEEAKSEGFKQLERVAMLINKRVSKTITKEPTPARLQSFSWTGSQPQLVALWQALKDAEYIDPKTTEKAFTAIFSGEPIDNSLSRVTWIKKAQKSKQVAKSAVIALFDILANAGKIPKAETTNGAELFRKLQSCFCDEAGKPLKFEHKHTSYSKENTDLLQQIISSL